MFNEHFSERGWIAFESMNYPLLEKCLALADKGKIEEAEFEMISYYKADNTIFLIKSLKVIEEFKVRYDLIFKAYEDYRQQRYYAMIPVMLMMIDGAVSDILKANKGFFTEGADLTAWDSLSGHESGLTNLAKIFNKGRYKTNINEITVPYRNGILHGMDLNYANEIVATKTLVALFAIKDWALIIKSGNNVIPEQETKKSFMNTVKEIGAHKEKMNTIHKKIDAWKAREFSATEIDSNTFELNSPEREFMTFLENFLKKNYGAIAQQLDFFPKRKNPINMEANVVRGKLKDVELKSYTIIKVKDLSPAITEIVVRLNAVCDKKAEVTKSLKINLIAQFVNGRVALRDEVDGINAKWYIIENKLWDIYNIKFQPD